MFHRFTLVDADVCCVALTFLAAHEETPPDQHVQAMETHDKILAWSVRSARAAKRESARLTAQRGVQLGLFEDAPLHD